MAKTLGPFEQTTLMAVFRLRDNAYGRTIHDEMEARVNRELSMGAMYSTLDRLTEDGLLTAKYAPGPASQGGRSRRYYQVTGKGIAALNESKSEVDSLWAGLAWPLES